MSPDCNQNVIIGEARAKASLCQWMEITGSNFDFIKLSIALYFSFSHHEEGDIAHQGMEDFYFKENTRTHEAIQPR